MEPESTFNPEVLFPEERAGIRTLLESINQGIIIIDETGTILFVNSFAERMFGYKREEIRGKNHDIFIPQRYRDIHHREMKNYFKEPRKRPMGIGLELTALRSNGEEFPVEINLNFVNKMERLFVLSFVVDISLRVGIAEELQRRTKELTEMNSALESFSYSVSHDLRAPLHAILGFSQVLLEDYWDKLDRDGRDYLQRIVASGKIISGLISDILRLSGISTREIFLEKTDLGAIAQSVITELQEREPNRQVETVLPRGLIVTGDKKLLQIALSNLLQNSWKFTQKNPSPRIELGVTYQDGEKTFYIKDNGAGFKMNTDRLFKPFQRLHSDGEFPGTGIGLTIVERVIRRHGGKIRAESEPGRGATFYFTLSQ